MTLKELATNVFIAHDTGNNNACLSLGDQLFRAVYGSNGHLLTKLDNAESATVGIAFAVIATTFEWGDKDFNSVAAENAFYCLAKSIINTNNANVAPALFSLLENHTELLSDKLINYWRYNAKEQGVLGFLGYMSKKEMTESAWDMKESIEYFLLTKFYDVDAKKYKVPVGIPYLLPNEKQINAFIQKAMSNGKADERLGEKGFMFIYNDCKYVLENC